MTKELNDNVESEADNDEEEESLDQDADENESGDDEEKGLDQDDNEIEADRESDDDGELDVADADYSASGNQEAEGVDAKIKSADDDQLDDAYESEFSSHSNDVYSINESDDDVREDDDNVEGGSKLGDDEGEEVKEEDTNGNEVDANTEGKSDEDKEVTNVENSDEEEVGDAIANITENNAEDDIGIVEMKLDDLKYHDKSVDDNEGLIGYSSKERGKYDGETNSNGSGDVPMVEVMPRNPAIGPEMEIGPLNPAIGGIRSDHDRTSAKPFADVDGTKIATAAIGSYAYLDIESAGAHGIVTVMAVLFIVLFFFVRMRRTKTTQGYRTLPTGYRNPQGRDDSSAFNMEGSTLATPHED
jgi:hypothetical protein